MKWQRIDHPEIGRVVDRPRFQEASDLVRQDIVSVSKQVAHDTFRATETIPGRGIEIADPGLLRRLDQLCRLAVIEIDEIAAERRAAESERVDHEACLSNLAFFHNSHFFLFLGQIICLAPTC